MFEIIGQKPRFWKGMDLMQRPMPRIGRGGDMTPRVMPGMGRGGSISPWLNGEEEEAPDLIPSKPESGPIISEEEAEMIRNEIRNRIRMGVAAQQAAGGEDDTPPEYKILRQSDQNLSNRNLKAIAGMVNDALAKSLERANRNLGDYESRQAWLDKNTVPMRDELGLVYRRIPRAPAAEDAFDENAARKRAAEHLAQVIARESNPETKVGRTPSADELALRKVLQEEKRLEFRKNNALSALRRGVLSPAAQMALIQEGVLPDRSPAGGGAPLGPNMAILASLPEYRFGSPEVRAAMAQRAMELDSDYQSKIKQAEIAAAAKKSPLDEDPELFKQLLMLRNLPDGDLLKLKIINDIYNSSMAKMHPGLTGAGAGAGAGIAPKPEPTKEDLERAFNSPSGDRAKPASRRGNAKPAVNPNRRLMETLRAMPNNATTDDVIGMIGSDKFDNSEIMDILIELRRRGITPENLHKAYAANEIGLIGSLFRSSENLRNKTLRRQSIARLLGTLPEFAGKVPIPQN